MKIIRKTRVCGCCGKKFEGVIPVSYYRNNYGLDNKPENPNDVPFIEKCPVCGYCSFSIEKRISEEGRKIVMSKDYQSVLNAGNEDETIRRLRAMLRMPEELMQKIYIHLRLCWIYEDTGKNTEALRERTIADEQMEESFREKQNSGIPVEEMMLYIDCLRQLGKWKEVKEIIGEVDDEIKSQLNSEHLIRRIFEFEKKAVEMHDQTPHNIGEV